MKAAKKVVKDWVKKAEEDFGFASASLELEDYYA